MNAIETIQNAYPLTAALLVGLGVLTVIFFVLELRHCFAPMPRLLGVPRGESVKLAVVETPNRGIAAFPGVARNRTFPATA